MGIQELHTVGVFTPDVNRKKEELKISSRQIGGLFAVS